MGEETETIAPRADGEVVKSDNDNTNNGDGSNPTTKEAPQDNVNPFDQYYAQLTHQQNMLQDSVRVSAYQRAIIDNAVDFKARRFCPRGASGVGVVVWMLRRFPGAWRGGGGVVRLSTYTSNTTVQSVVVVAAVLSYS